MSARAGSGIVIARAEDGCEYPLFEVVPGGWAVKACVWCAHF